MDGAGDKLPQGFKCWNAGGHDGDVVFESGERLSAAGVVVFAVEKKRELTWPR